jgi:indole-3-glycerol phosphate synthase
MSRALDGGARIIGVNSRSLRTLEVSLDTTYALAAQLGPSVIGVAESGIRTRQDLDTLRAHGYSAFLVGERLVSDPDPGAALTRLMAGTGTSGDVNVDKAAAAATTAATPSEVVGQ